MKMRSSQKRSQDHAKKINTQRTGEKNVSYYDAGNNKVQKLNSERDIYSREGKECRIQAFFTCLLFLLLFPEISEDLRSGAMN